MGPRLLCFAGGAALTAFFVFLGLLATPFFGSGAFLWANIFASFLLSLALGYGLGDLVATLAGPKRLESAAPRLAVAGGIGTWLAAYSLPWTCRWVLGFDPNWFMAPAVAIALTSLIPGALIAAIVPSELRVRLVDCDAQTGTRNALRLLGLMTLGGVFGIALTAKPVLRADEVDVWLYAYGTGAALAIIGLVFLGNVGRVVTIVFLAGLVSLSAAHQSEIQEEQFAVALELAWKEGHGAGLYYHRTADTDMLSEEELREHYERITSENEMQKPGIILTCEMLQRLGPVTVSGEGLRGTLELLINPEAQVYIMPIFEQVQSIRSDGKGLLDVRIKRKRGEEGVRFYIPGKEAGEKIEFWFRGDFTAHLIQTGNVWKLEFGPVATEHAGIFEVNDTMRTPIRLLNVFLWVDASVLGIILEDYPESVAMKVVAQGDVGGVKTKDVITVPKTKNK